MGKENRPLVLFPLVETLHVSVGRFGGKVRNDVPQPQASVGGTLRVQAHVHLGTGFHRVHGAFTGGVGGKRGLGGRTVRVDTMN